MVIYLRVRRLFDLLGALLLLVLLLPLLLALALMIRISMGRPILFRQPRVGYRGRIFHIVKFRTMLNSTDADGKLLPDEQRLRWFGRMLRSSSLDELPEVWNIITGDMSFVGPRPLLVPYLPLYSEEQARRHDVTPGITGWAQVNGRNALSWDEKFRFDVWYVDHVSLWLDLKILVLTVVRVLKRDGISSEGHATMPPFAGNGHS